MLKNTHTQREKLSEPAATVYLTMALAEVCVSSDLLPAGRHVFFRAPVRSDLTSETERGPFASPQTVKVPQESNAAACCHDQRSAGKPDGDADAHNCHLKEGGKFSLQRLLFGVCGQDTLFFFLFFLLIRLELGPKTEMLQST